LGLAIIIAAPKRIIQVKHAAGAAIVAIFGYYLAQRYEISFATIDRLTSNTPGSSGQFDLTSGRDTIFWQSLTAFFDHPILGPGTAAYEATYGSMPHFSPLTFAINAGMAGAVIGLALIFNLASLTICGWQVDNEPSHMMTRSLAAVLLVMALLEPDGPFLGVGLVTVLFIAAALSAQQHANQPSPVSARP
jgi:hypothetical protein